MDERALVSDSSLTVLVAVQDSRASVAGVIRLTDLVRQGFTHSRFTNSQLPVNHHLNAHARAARGLHDFCTPRKRRLHWRAASFVYRSATDWTDQSNARTQGGTTMKNLKTIGIVAALALGLTTAAFAKPLELQTLDSAGKNITPTVTFSTQGFSSTNNDQNATLDVYVPGWSLGVVGIELNGANLKISDVKAAAGITVSLKDASGGATKDLLKFEVKAAANLPKGSYPVQVLLVNKKFGEQGMITIVAEVK
jgi:hypothetical protein